MDLTCSRASSATLICNSLLFKDLSGKSTIVLSVAVKLLARIFFWMESLDYCCCYQIQTCNTVHFTQHLHSPTTVLIYRGVVVNFYFQLNSRFPLFLCTTCLCLVTYTKTNLTGKKINNNIGS